MDQLQAVVRRAVYNIGEIVAYVDARPGSLKERHRRVLALEMESLRSLDRELSTGELSRRSWSLGQASIPVLHAMMNAVRRSDADVPQPLVDRAATSISDLADALIRSAEGRT